jgi:heme o synthase
MKTIPATADSARPHWLADYAAVGKARLTTLVVAAAIGGFYLGLDGAADTAIWQKAIATAVGVFLVVIGANAMNQLIECRQDARMLRTSERPLASGRLTKGSVLTFVAVTTSIGLAVLWFLASVPAALLAIASWGLYVFAYTPLKLVTPWSVVVGAIPGALPPVIGWSAAIDGVAAESWIIFAIMFCWQIPHFWAIAWLYRDDYANADYRVVSVVDPRGRRLTVEMLAYTLVLIPISLLPTYFQIAGQVYYFGAMIGGFVFLAFTVEVVRLRNRKSARRHLFVSLIYLTLLFALMTLDKVSA